ncbi:Shikimate 5-dehydrogenase I alpha [Paraburkholderia tropica]|uniref:shikimate dehydrogenase family protein n=1 Tax=Paraburkholderia tropica TaxID=92647 RepID=UPI001CADCC88|nr:shikimate dehydrogenase [Paraburkholderia tropica]CAG9222912.1 Shikimate 5-dehydrogenase I alpha [Paraburkholderia tropica]
MVITGKTGVFFMVADPIDQVRTPEIFNQVFEQLGIDAVMVPLNVKADHLTQTIRSVFESPTTRGMVLSIPHKTAAAQLVDHLTAGAQVANSVNAIRRNQDGTLEGAQFDGIGFVESMDRYSMNYRGKSVLLIGAGGAASAICTALAEGGVASLAIFDVDSSKAEALVQAIAQRYPIRTAVQENNDPAGFDVVINASPVGLKDSDPLPVPAERIGAHTQVCDILMKNQPTPLLRAAMAKGNAVLPGFDMLILQSPLFLEFFGVKEAAEQLRKDDTPARDLLFPHELRSMVKSVA